MTKMAPEVITSPNSLELAALLERRINDGRYLPGHWLPTEREMADEFGVHRRTIRGAIIHLAQAGRLICRPRCRPLVAGDYQPSVEQARSIEANPAQKDSAGSRLVALIMWHGGFEPRASAQQRIFWGFNRVLSQAGYHGVFLDLGEEIESEDENAAREAARLQYALDHNFAGIVFYPYAYRRNRGLIREVARRLPFVLIDRQIPGVEADYVGIDNLRAMQDATAHLMAQGHSRIALVTRSEPINTVQDRISGYREAMRSAEPPAPDHVLTVDSDLEWSMFDLIFRLPASERPTALLCVNDYLALQVAERVEALGVRVPDDVALVGFDDLVQTLRTGIGLTSVAQPFEEIGSNAARFVMDRVANPKLHARHVELPASVSVRGSSGKNQQSHGFGASMVKMMLDTVPK